MATFMLLMNENICPILGNFVVDFVDDKLVLSKTQEKPVNRLRTVFGIINDHTL